MRIMIILAFAFIGCLGLPARAETTLCTQITSVPFTINLTGTYCLKSDLATNLSSGNMITINANNVVIDFNDFKLGGIAGGPGTAAVGIYANGRTSITIRNGSIRGFHTAIRLDGLATDQSAHLIENMRIDSSRIYGIYMVGGVGSTIRNNRISNTGSTAATYPIAIYIDGATSATVADNTVSSVYSSFSSGATGLFFYRLERSEITRNSVSTVTGGSDLTQNRPIFVWQSKAILIKDNALFGLGAGSFSGIRLVETTLGYCVRNDVLHFTSAISGCSTLVDNNDLW